MNNGAVIDPTGVLVLDNATLHINSCYLTKNSIQGNSVISAKNSKISVEQTIFRDHTSNEKFLIDDIFIKSLESSKSHIFTDNIFINNSNIHDIINVVSENVNTMSYIMVNNCTFKENDADPFDTNNVKRHNHL